MLKKNSVSNDTIYVSIAHNNLLIKKYLNELEKYLRKFLCMKKKSIISKLNKIFLLSIFLKVKLNEKFKIGPRTVGQDSPTYL